ncbi:MAG TPA: threonylcarbamoyl-AMP synthase, partial [Streptosporangiaceae bacterium]
GDVPRLLRAGVIPIDKIREVTGVIEDPPEPEPPADEAMVEAEAQAETAGAETAEEASQPAAKEQ